MHELEQGIGLRGIEAGREVERAMNPVARRAVEPVVLPPAQIELSKQRFIEMRGYEFC
jgi:hypothetical protein